MIDYNSIQALNWSTLKYMAISALECHWRMDHPAPRKVAFILGGAIHTKTLEPDKFAERYALCEVKRDKRTAAYQIWCDEHPGAEPLKPDEMDRVIGAAEAVLRHRVAAEILRGCRHEEPLTWTDPKTGLACKGRLDAIGPTHIVDLKMARDPSPWAFGKAAASYGYHAQLAFYHHGAAEARKISGAAPPYIIAVCGLPPHDVAVYRLSADDLAAGRQLCLSLMRKYQECVAANMWPGCAPDLTPLVLPAWAPGFTVDEESEEW
jgi:hypothetical protein